MKKILLLLLIIIQCSQVAYAGPQPEKVTLQLQWKHQFEFAGFYAAKEKGFYRDAGFEVEFVEFQEGTDQVEEVLSGRVTFSTWGAGLIGCLVEGKPLIFLANYLKKSPLVILTKPHIHTPADLRGKKLMIAEVNLKNSGFNHMFENFNLLPQEITFVPSTFNINVFINNEVDAYSAFLTNEPFILKQHNIPYNVLDPSHYGTELYDLNLFTKKSLVQNRPGFVQSFVDACNRGWIYALAHPEEMVELILQRYNTQQKSRAALLFEAREIAKLMQPELYPVGSIDMDKVRKIGVLFSRNISAASISKYEEFVLEQSQTAQIKFTPEEQDYLNHKKKIIMCVDPSWMPFECLDQNGQHHGMAAEILAIVQQRSGIKLETVITKNWTESIEFAKARKCDIFSLAMETPERKKYMDFTKPYISMPFAIATKIEEPFIERIENVLDKPLAMVKGYAYVEILKNRYPTINLIEVGNMLEGLKLLRSGQIYGFIDTLATIAYTIQKEGMVDIKIAGRFDDTWQLAIGTRNDEPILNSIMQKALLTISNKEKREIYNSWYSIRVESGYDYIIIGKILAVSLLIIIGFTFWNRQLAVAKKRTTETLEQLNLLQTALEDKNRQLERVATTDRLTGLYNRAKIDETLVLELSRSQRFARPFALIILDIDFFKDVNDKHGHQTGDQVLIAFSQLLQKRVRDVDTLGRWGGEEFLITCPDTNHSGVLKLAETLRTTIEKCEFPTAGRKTASFGVTIWQPEDNPITIIARADKALYAAKHNGRNRVEIL
ncbi:MAG: diguanylate cyclase [Desulfuromusa sp.]|nr:diguanylate cyclase [Desulfuromusa sp.]